MCSAATELQSLQLTEGVSFTASDDTLIVIVAQRCKSFCKERCMSIILCHCKEGHSACDMSRTNNLLKVFIMRPVTFSFTCGQCSN